MECVGELKLLAELIEARGIAAMREAISNTAELGAVHRRAADRRRARARSEMRDDPRRRSAAARFAATLADEAAGLSAC